MKNVYFHIQADNDSLAPEHFLSCILEQHILHEHKVCVFCNDQPHASQLSKHVWSFPPNAFMPHVIKDNMLITEGPFKYKTILNMSDDCILNLKIDVIELVFANEYAKTKARERFKIYKLNGFNLKHIKEKKYK